MIKRLIFLSLLFVLISCESIELVLKESISTNQFKDKTIIVINGNKEEVFTQELFSFFGNNQEGEYILITAFSEKKENRLVKKNQVAEKIDYELTASYEIFYKNRNCKIYNKKITTQFSFVPKSFGYNFATDRSIEKLYRNSIRNNIQNFIYSAPKGRVCKE